jgi:DNA-directed RNA polymerase specialized sigma24 family protein
VSLQALHRQLIARALQLGLGSHDAEDIAQEIWLALASRHQLTEILSMPNAGGYLHTMLRNRIRNAWRDQRRLKRGGGQHLQTLDDVEVADPRPQPDEQIALAELRDALTAVGAIDRTPNSPADRVRLHRQRLAWRQQLIALGITPRYSRPRP